MVANLAPTAMLPNSPGGVTTKPFAVQFQAQECPVLGAKRTSISGNGRSACSHNTTFQTQIANAKDGLILP